MLVLLQGKVTVDKNIIRNMNSGGIVVQDSYDTAEVYVSNNEIYSDIYGSHSHGWSDAAYGITAHSLFAFGDLPGYKIDIWGNKITLNKANCARAEPIIKYRNLIHNIILTSPSPYWPSVLQLRYVKGIYCARASIGTT